MGVGQEAGLTKKRASFWRRNRWLMWVGGGLLAGLVVAGGIVAVLARRVEPVLRARIVEGLQDRFHARVELDGFHVSLGGGLRGPWGVWAEGNGLRIRSSEADVAVAGTTGPWHAGAVEPLVRLEEFRFHAPLHYEPGKPFHI